MVTFRPLGRFALVSSLSITTNAAVSYRVSVPCEVKGGGEEAHDFLGPLRNFLASENGAIRE